MREGLDAASGRIWGAVRRRDPIRAGPEGGAAHLSTAGWKSPARLDARGDPPKHASLAEIGQGGLVDRVDASTGTASVG